VTQLETITPQQLGIPHTIPLPRRSDWRIGLIGFGGIAQAHVRAYRRAGWPIVAVADPDPDARQRAREQLGDVRLYDDYPELIADGEVEVLTLLTHPTIREPAIALAARAGKPVLTEKPLARDLAECERMVALAEAAGIPFAVSQNYRWSGANFFARYIVERGLIGTPFHASIEIYGRQDVDLAEHPFYAVCDDFLTVQWNTHLADLLRCWMGRDPQRVMTVTRRMPGQYFVSDNLLISVVDYGPGFSGHVVHSELLRSSLTRTACRVDGDGGSLLFDLHGDRLVLDSAALGGGPRQVVFDELLPSMCGTMGDLLISIEEGREPQVSARRNLATIRHVLAEQRSACQGGAWIAL
jgi:predicted dehydrogenase